MSIGVENLKENGYIDGLSDYPFDELFIWSLLLFDGSDDTLIFYYWSLCSNSMACMLVAIVIYTKLRDCNCIPDDLKAKLVCINK